MLSVVKLSIVDAECSNAQYRLCWASIKPIMLRDVILSITYA